MKEVCELCENLFTEEEDARSIQDTGRCIECCDTLKSSWLESQKEAYKNGYKEAEEGVIFNEKRIMQAFTEGREYERKINEEYKRGFEKGKDETLNALSLT